MNKQENVLLKLSEYLIRNEKKYLITLSISMILYSISIAAIWAYPLIENNILKTMPLKLLWSIILSLSLLSFALYSYIRYTYNENNVKIILKNYTQNNKYCIPAHKKSKVLICPKCLKDYVLEYQVKEYSEYCQCTLCGKKYHYNEENWNNSFSTGEPR